MNHRTVTRVAITEHYRDRDGRERVRTLESIRLVCDRCGWETRAIKSNQPAPGCLCGGQLQWQPETKPGGKA